MKERLGLRIGVDAWNLPGDRRGIGRYVRNIVREWRNAKEVDVALIIPESLTLFAASRYRAALGDATIPVLSRAASGRGRFDVVWFPWNGMSWIAAGVSVATLHDASLFAHPPADGEFARKEQQPFVTAAEHA
ncbi:MAG TPA: hypothetical protein VEJ20_04125, partial [Candidatus Eremiobacteraceae bacterium]|nr:hypothetical protein [Candidatus Eremiobacteraceae bacterium]